MSTLFIFVFLGAFAGGLVNGLSGFGTGLTALPFWLIVLPPQLASPLAVVCSVVSQAGTLPKVWRIIDFKKVKPLIIGGLIGVPVGTFFLPLVSLDACKTGVGILLVSYCSFQLISRAQFQVIWGGELADGFVGLAGGVLGGLVGLSGPLPTIWANIRGWGKDTKRGVFQAYNGSILFFAFISQSVTGIITVEKMGHLFLLALPGTLVGVWCGRRLYARLSDRRFDHILMVMLLISGWSLLISVFG